MISSIISRVVILVFGTLYPAYASYKAVRTKNLKEYVKWMMYWIVFALFTCAETFTDVFLSWFPFYYEVKIVLVLWLLSPATRGSSILYRKFVHPALSRREQEIDDAISKAKEQGYHTVLNLGSKGVNYATNVIMQTAIRGGGGLVQQLKKSYSLSDLTEAPRPAGAGEDVLDEADDVLTDPRLIRRNVARSGYNTRRSASESNNRTPIYFSEVDVDMRSTRAATRGDMPDFSHIKSSEDISSGYSSAENSAALRGGAAGAADAADGASAGLARAGSVGAAARPRTRLAARTVTTIKRPGAAEGSEVISEELEDDENFDFTDLPPLLNLPSSYHISHTNPPYLFEYVGNQIKIVQMLGDVSQCYFPEKKAIHMSQSESPVVQISLYNTSMTDGTVVDHNDKKEAIPEISPKDVPILIIPINDKTVKDNIDKVVNIDQDVPIVPYYTAEEKFKIEQEKNKSEKIKDTFDQPLGYIDNISLLTVHSKHLDSVSSSSASLNSAKTAPSIKKENVDGEAASIETSSLDDIMVETDEEASYGTPDDSPKAKKKQEKRGKYGKSRAPPPPPDVKDDSKIVREQEVEDSNEKEKNYAGIRSLNNDSINKNVFAEPSVSKHALVQDSSYSVKLSEVSPSYGNIPERENKQKSPTGKKIKPSNSPITRLMQLPGKFVFWHKSEDKCKSDTWSTSSDELSRRSSTVDYISDEFQSCVDLQEATNMASLDDGQTENIPTITVFSSVDENTEKVATDITLTDVDLEESAIVKDIIDKSDALQKLIEAKLESHPEYKIIPLHDEEIPTTSKSTQV